MTAAVLAVKQRLERRSAEALVLGALAVALAGVAASGIGEVWQGIVARAGHWSPTRIGTIASLLAGLATAVGAAPVFFVSRVPERRRAMLLAFGPASCLRRRCFRSSSRDFRPPCPRVGRRPRR